MLDLSLLNEAQREAVLYNEGPQLVVAGAGSGKTRVLTAKMAYLMDQGVKPWRIMALTFTNKAADEMKERIAQQMGADAQKIVMGTFHSIFARMLRVNAELLGYKQNYTIYDESDSRSLLKVIVKELELDDNVYKPSSIGSRISLMKNRLVSAQIYRASSELFAEDRMRKMPRFGEIYQLYQERCQTANAMDFDDLLMNAYLLFAKHPEICRQYDQRYDYILVDEFQDTNYAQQQILLQLRSGENHNICVVGDDYQSIYGFRGANIDNILTFQRVFAEAKVFKLEQNYRSTQTIVSAANGLMKHNRNQIDKNVFSRQAVGNPLLLLEAQSDREEAIVVCKQIARLRRSNGLSYEDFTILYRTNAQSRVLEEELQRRAIPFRIYGGTGFYQRKEIKDIIAYFRLTVNPDDDEAFRRIVNFPARGIGNTTLAKLTDHANMQGISLWRAAVQLLQGEGSSSLASAARKHLAAFVGLMEELQAMQVQLNASELTQLLFQRVDFWSLYPLSDKTPENLSRRENLGEMVDSISEFVEQRMEEGQTEEISLVDYLQEVSLLTSVDASEQTAEGQKGVTLMTIHMAKGLEFPAVFIVGLEENLFPNMQTASTLSALEEERRLLYVAITRAKEHCILSYAKQRWQFGQMTFNMPSRFLRDLDPSLIEREQLSSTLPLAERRPKSSVSNRFATPPKRENLVRIPPSGPYPGDMGVTSSSTAPLAVGDIIEHQRFGIGKVLAVEGSGDGCKATVEFRNAGTKQLLLKFAKYRKL